MNETYSVPIEHLLYLKDDFGLKGFIREFPQGKSLSFVRWISNEIKSFGKSPPESGYLTLQFPSAHLDIAVFGLSIIAFRIVSRSIGRDNADAVKKIIDQLNKAKEKLLSSGSGNDEHREFFNQTTDDFRSLLASNVKRMYDEVLDFGNHHAKLPMAIPDISPTLDFNLVRAGRSWAKGDIKVKLCLDQFVRGFDDKSFFYHEYKSIRMIPAIGEFQTKDWTLPVYALICHELAHTFQIAVGREAQKKGDFELSRLMSKAHGKGWQAIYEILRVKFVNSELDLGGEADDGAPASNGTSGAKGGVGGGIALKVDISKVTIGNFS